MQERTPRGLAHERLSRSFLFGVGTMAVLSIIVPISSFYIDQHEAEDALRTRTKQMVELLAQALELQLLTLESELKRLAERPEIDFADETKVPEKALLRQSHEKSALFGGGVALLDLAGKVVSAIPHNGFAELHGYADRPWFQKSLRLKKAVADQMDDDSGRWILLVPILRREELAGFVLGVVEEQKAFLSFRLDDTQDLALVDEDDVLLRLPASRHIPTKALAQAQAARSSDGLLFHDTERRLLAFAAPVRSTLELWLVSEVDPVIRPIRQRLIWQLLLLTLFQVSAWLAFAFFVRRNYRQFKQLEMKLFEEEKRARLGEASSLIAHEIKNTLNGISSALSYQLPESSDNPLARRVVKSQLSRLSHLARSLLSLGRPVHAHNEPILLNNVLHDTLETLKILPEFSNVVLSMKLPPEVKIDADASLVVTAIDNVVRNAIEAAVAFRDIGKTTEAIVEIQCEKVNDWACLSVQDNGGGLNENVQEKLFQPFVSSKPKGIGLGLSTTYQAMNAIHGQIEYEATANGSIFRLLFPLSKEGNA